LPDYIFIRTLSEPGASGQPHNPTNLIDIALGISRYVLVVEPSPTFRYRSSAADYPIRFTFQTFAFIFSDSAVVKAA